MFTKIISLLRTIKKEFLSFYIKTFHRITFHKQNVKILYEPVINGMIFVSNKGRIIIGAGFRANSGKNKNPIGGDTILRLICLENSELIIGNDVSISNSTILAKHSITIEDNVMIGGSCKIWDTDFHSLDYKIRGTDKDSAIDKPILIKNNAFIGASSIILKGVTIGENAIVAAGSVVSKSIPANEIWGGNPAKFIKTININ